MSLLDNVKIVTTATGSKDGKLYSVIPEGGQADFDITRATTATVTNSSGLLETVAANVPQIDFEGGGCGCFVVEPQRTNLHLYSEEIDNAAYLKSDVTVSANAIISPDGTTNADECTTTSNFAQMYQAITLAASTTYTWSFYVKRGTMTDIGQQIFNMNGDGEYGTGGKYYSQTTATGWARVSFTFTTGSNGGTTRFYPINSSGVTGTIYLWGFQLEQYSITTSYIPTTSASFTRVKTVWEASALSSIIDPLEGVFMAEIRFRSVPSNTGVMSLSSGSTSNMINIGYWGGYFGQVTMNGSHLLFGIGTQPALDTDFHKIAVKYKSGDCAIYFDGVKTTSTTTTGAPTGTNLNMISGTYGNSSGFWPFFGDIKQLQVYDTILSHDQLVDLTT